MRILEAWGRLMGGIAAPFAALGSLTRNARLFHPDGVLYSARVDPLAKEGPIGELAKRLQGPAIVRLSSAWWRNEKEWPDILGIAVRFLDSDKSAAKSPGPRDQDLLFATIPALPLMPVAPLFTRQHDFFANQYPALLPFAVEGLGRVKFRIVTMRLPSNLRTRRQKLEARVAAGTAVLRLEMRSTRPGAIWTDVAMIVLREKSPVDESTLLFDPFRSGRGIVPVGFFQMARAAIYKASYLGRTITRAK